VAMGLKFRKSPKVWIAMTAPGASPVLEEAKEKHLQGIPGTAAQLGEEFSIIKKVTPEDFGQAEGEVAVRDGLEDFLTEPFAKFHHTLLMAGGQKCRRLHEKAKIYSWPQSLHLTRAKPL